VFTSDLLLPQKVVCCFLVGRHAAIWAPAHPLTYIHFLPPPSLIWQEICPDLFIKKVIRDLVPSKCRSCNKYTAASQAAWWDSRFPRRGATERETLRRVLESDCWDRKCGEKREAQHVFIHVWRMQGWRSLVILECFLPSFPVSWSVCHTHFPPQPGLMSFSTRPPGWDEATPIHRELNIDNHPRPTFLTFPSSSLQWFWECFLGTYLLLLCIKSHGPWTPCPFSPPLGLWMKRKHSIQLMWIHEQLKSTPHELCHVNGILSLIFSSSGPGVVSVVTIPYDPAVAAGQ